MERYFLLCLFAGHSVMRDGQQELVYNDCDANDQTCRSLPVEAKLRSWAKLYPNVYIVGIFSQCREASVEVSGLKMYTREDAKMYSESMFLDQRIEELMEQALNCQAEIAALNKQKKNIESTDSIRELVTEENIKEEEMLEHVSQLSQTSQYTSDGHTSASEEDEDAVGVQLNENKKQLASA